jgi:putative oxidoreductase
MRTWQQLDKLDEVAGDTAGIPALPLLRTSLALVYIWFGALKLIGASPVANMVAQTAEPLPRHISVPAMGLVELAIGLGLLLRLAVRPVLLLFFIQNLGTFTTVIRRPERIFQNGNPLLLTKEGEFLLKNLVLLAAGLTIASQEAT